MSEHRRTIETNGEGVSDDTTRDRRRDIDIRSRMTGRRRLPPGARWVTTQDGVRRVELVVDLGADPVSGRRRQSRRRFVTEAEARAQYAEITKAVREGTHVPKTHETVEQACKAWLLSRRRTVRASTLAGYETALKPVIVAYGALPIQKLTRKNIDDLIDGLVAGDIRRDDKRKVRPWKPRTVNLMLFTLGRVLDSAVAEGRLVRNVARLVERSPQSRLEMATWTPSEIETVLASIHGTRMEVAWILALYGLRRGEVAGLRWEDISDTELTIRNTRLSVDGAVTDSMPKTDSGARDLPLPPNLKVALNAARARQQADRKILGAAYNESGYVVTDEGGSPLHPDTFTSRFELMVREAGVSRIRLHDARHTCGTLMHLQGHPTAVISAWLGHSSPAFTMRTYVHSQKDALTAAANAFDGLFGSSSDIRVTSEASHGPEKRARPRKR